MMKQFVLQSAVLSIMSELTAAGAELAGSLTGAIGLSDMYSTDAMQLSGYEVPMNDMGMSENIYASSYANNLY